MNYICVISDSHSRRHLIEELLPVINKADLFVFLGDCTGDIYNFRSEIKPQIVAVSGNCDIIKAYPDEEIFEWQKHRFFATHGHKYHVKRDYSDLAYAATERGCDCVLFGHTHQSVIERLGGVVLVNPGSIAEPRFSKPSYALIYGENGKIFPKIISYEH